MNMTILKARDKINNLVKEFFSIGENATEAQFREAYAKMEQNKDIWQWLEQSNYSAFIQDTVYFVEKFEGASKALVVIENLYPNYEDVCPYDYPNKAHLHEIWARLYVIQKNEGSAYAHLKQATYFRFIDNVSYDGFEYFSFRGFSDYALDDIKNNTICLAHPSTFNDPMDTILLRWNQYQLLNTKDKDEYTLRMLYQKAYDHVKVRCFVRTNQLPRDMGFFAGDGVAITKEQHIEDVNPLMWAHYADNHKGFCLKYKFPATLVNTNDRESLTWTRIGNVNYIPDMVFQQNFTIYDALFAKHEVWSYENEVRLIHYDATNEDNYKTIKVPDDAIQAIYLGIKCSDVNREKIKLILRNRNIKLFQMEIDDADAYKLVKKRIL